MTVVIVDNYDSFTYNLYQMVQFQASLSKASLMVQVVRNDAMSFDDLKALQPNRVILSPGPGHPGNPKDFGLCQQVITQWKELSCPVLGVCLGHQGLIHYMGGTIEKAPTIVHGKTSLVHHEKESPLLAGLSNPFQAMRYHSLVSSEANFPKVLKVIARETSSHQLIMAVQHESLPLYGVQFHPESIGTPEGEMLLRNFLERC
ncbi:MAG: aminodeoxychorismate/anthranilate synthase component II [Cyanobacteria bacterium]|nr:aminodeoxychorismate/anthranilate synthase component II [Cyanobacteriota bacterium]